jgi:branched-chain amino acid aminotransferase
MDSLIFHNDRILPLREATLSPGQMGLLMGWGVFTTLRIYQGIPFAFERHWARLAHDADRLHLDLLHKQADARAAIMALARANGRAEGTARVSFVKNRGGLWAQAEGLPETDMLVFTRGVHPWPAAHRLKLQPQGVFSRGDYAGAKVLSWVRNADVLEKAHSEGLEDALLMNEKDQLAECTSANAFVVRQGKVYTPPLSSGCLPGITRQILLEVVPKTGIDLIQAELMEKDLADADEVFISSTTREVAAVSEVYPHWKYPAPGPLTRAIDKAFKEYVKNYLAKAGSEDVR